MEVKLLEKIIGETFRNETVNLDFTAYEKCSFINCTIHTHYGIFSLIGCVFTDCKLSLGGPAENVAKLIKLFFGDRPIDFLDLKNK